MIDDEYFYGSGVRIGEVVEGEASGGGEDNE